MTSRTVRLALLTLLTTTTVGAVAACSSTTDGSQRTASGAGSQGAGAGAATSVPATASTEPGSPAASGSTSATASAAATSCTYTAGGAAARKVSLPPSTPRSARTLTLALTVSGTAATPVTVALTPQATPCTVNSIAHLAQAKYYDDTRCHRLTTTGIYVLQCGDPTGTGTGGPGYSFADELTGSETYPAGTVAMANAGPDTNGSQFFLVYKDSQLGPQYTVFGRITGGLDVLIRVAAGGAQPSGDGAPKLPVVITHATAS